MNKWEKIGFKIFWWSLFLLILGVITCAAVDTSPWFLLGLIPMSGVALMALNDE